MVVTERAWGEVEVEDECRMNVLVGFVTIGAGTELDDHGYFIDKSVQPSCASISATSES